MTEKRRIFFFDFSPDGGKTFFPLCDHRGFRIWSSARALPKALALGHPGLRYLEREMEFDEVPENFDLGVVGTRMLNDEDQKWLPDRTEVEIVFTTAPAGFSATVKAADQTYKLRRASELGEPCWRLISDVMDWFVATLDGIEPRGYLGRDCEVYVAGMDIFSVAEGKQPLGSELRLGDFLNGWMATIGHAPWGEQ